MRTGIWLVGGRGSVATTTVVGAAAIRAQALPPVGCVSMLAPFAGLGLPGFADLVFGGHDLTQTTLVKRAEQVADAGVVPHGLLALARDDLLAADAEIRPGIDAGADTDRPPADAVDAVVADLADFRRRLALDRVIVLNVSSTEAPAPPDPAHASLPALRSALRRPSRTGRPVLPSSSLYAFAAMLAGCPFVDFTPSTGPRLPALDELARQQRVPYAGSDGKTGETLLKSALAPMFARRALRVRSWSGTNLLGGGDGETLADSRRAESKASSKRVVLDAALGYPVDGDVHIHHVPALGEWKTAWDHITFEGFLGVQMTLQFTWQGCDSALAAPLVLDLARFMDRAHRAGVHGPVPELGFFFKRPIGGGGHALDEQYAALVRWSDAL
jgi:myo-inositol-1-phosphate synthase